MKIKEAKLSDLEELMGLYDKMCKVLGSKDFMPGGNKGGFPPKETVENAINEGNQFIAVEDGKIIAAYILNHDFDEAYNTVPWQIEAKKNEISVMHALRVLPEYSGRGYSKKLLSHAIETAKARGRKTFRLDVLDGNKIPEKMYLAFGFRYISTVKITYPDIGAPMDFNLYELLL